MTGQITILATEHNTEESFQLVRNSIPEREPDVVAVELPPRYFAAGTPDWSLSAALDPTRDETLSGLLTQRLMLDGDYWQIDEMPLAARVASDHEIPVALIDRPFPVSIDQNGRGLFTDILRNLRVLQTEWREHTTHLSEKQWLELIERDLWRVGTAATPVLQYLRELRAHGATDLTDSEQRDQARKRFDEQSITTQLELMRLFVPGLIEANVADRDEQMAGHLRWLATEDYDVLTFVALGHVPGIKQRLDGEKSIAKQYVCEPVFADPSRIPEHPRDK